MAEAGAMVLLEVVEFIGSTGEVRLLLIDAVTRSERTKVVEIFTEE